MKIHEYQAKELLKSFNIPIPEGIMCTNTDEVMLAVSQLGFPCVIKAQVLVGGRGKAGGIKIVNHDDQARSESERILKLEIKGCKVGSLMVTKAVDIEKEYYLGFITDRNTKGVLMIVSSEGGVEIEEVARVSPEKIVKIPIDASTGIMPHHCREAGFSLFSDASLVKQLIPVIQNIYTCYLKTDASLIEINPLVLTPDKKLIALDAKINFDDNALGYHPEIEAMRQADEDELKELDAKAKGLTYIKLQGEIGCMVNGAGLAMATMDMIKLYGGNPANFLDIGGSSKPQKVVDAIQIILSDPNVKVILINIFGGITRCDDVAKGLLEAFRSMNIKVPVVVRLTGTNEKEGMELLKGQNFILASSMSEAARKAISLIKQ